MIILIAKINGSPGLEESESSAINAEFMKLGLNLPKKVFSGKKLLEVLEANKDDDVLLFTNFPPDSSYPGSGKKINIVDKGSYYNRSWDADSYQKSNEFFKQITREYQFQAIHFFTGAPENKISDEYLKSISDKVNITVKRRKDLMEKVSEYPRLYKQYVLTKLKETINE